MNTGAFLTCLNYLVINTGSSAILEGIYSPASGTTGYLFNQLYPSGFHINNGNIFAGAIPLINVHATQTIGNYFSGNQGFRAGYQHNGNFSVVMDIQYSGCTRLNNQPTCVQNVLLATCDSPNNLASGFMIGINDANRLSFKTLNTNSTLPVELSTRDYVYVSLTENQYVNFGIFRPSDNTLYSNRVALNNSVLNTNSIYFGNFLSGTDARFTGFYGNINNILLFSDDLASGDINDCAICSSVTGYTLVNSVQSFSGVQVTGVAFSGVQYFMQTGVAYITGYVQNHTGGLIPVVYSSGMMGYVASGEVTNPLFGQVVLQSSGQSLQFQYDTNMLNSFSTYSIEFDFALTSGDVLEIYTYPQYNPNVSKLIPSNIWPADTGYIQMVSNGLSETKDVDYFVVHNAMSGFNAEDLLSFDILPASGIVTDYSGYWLSERVLLSGGGYYPPAAQYLEPASAAGQVWITGMSGVCTANPFYPSFGYDLFLNGQKLVTGLQYNISGSGVGFVVQLSGINLPPIYINPMYSPTGGLPTGAYAKSNELSFLPYTSGVMRQITYATGVVKNIGNITGFSEQIWVNGVRQLRNADYMRRFNCSAIPTTLYFPPLNYTIYDSTNDGGYWNFA